LVRVDALFAVLLRVAVKDALQLRSSIRTLDLVFRPVSSESSRTSSSGQHKLQFSRLLDLRDLVD